MRAMGSWSAYLYDKNDTFMVELPYSSLSIDKVKNGYWTATIDVAYFKLSEASNRVNFTVDHLLADGFRSVKIFRNDVLQFAGILNECPIDGSSADVKVRLSFKGWLSYFHKRLITKTYSGVDSGLIGWDMIDTAQGEANGDIGVTQGTVEATKDRDRTLVNEYIDEVLIKLSADQVAGGGDFEISDSKVYGFFESMGSLKPEIVFDEANISSFNVAYVTGLNLTNQVLALGNGVSSLRNSAGTQQADRFLMTTKQSYGSVIETATLDDHGDEYLDKYEDFIKTPELTVVCTNVDIDDFGLGDTVTVKIGSPQIINGLYRIRQKTINVTADSETIKLAFDI